MAFPGVGAGYETVVDDPKDEDAGEPNATDRGAPKSPISKTRSLSDGGGTPKLSPSPHIFKGSRRQSKDDSAIRERDRDHAAQPSTPIRVDFPLRLQMPARELTQPVSQEPSASPYIKPAPLSPKLDHSFASPPTNILPRRSRGLDFSRAATSLHHSTLANPASSDSSPTIGSRAMNIPGRRAGQGQFGAAPEHALWATSGNQERMPISCSLGSNAHMISDTSSSSDEDDIMDEDMDEGFLLTPQAAPTRANAVATPATAASPWVSGGSPAVNSLMSFQQRQRPRKQPKRRLRGALGLGLSSVVQTNMSKSPPNNISAPKELPNFHSRRESISWINQLHISGSESDDNLKSQLEGPGMGSPSRPGVIRRTVTRRNNLLPKTKGFARIRAALAEESAPVEAEFRREAEVVRQVLESDMDLELRPPPIAHSAGTTAYSSPKMGMDEIDDVSEDAMVMDAGTAGGLNLSGSFKQQALKNSKGKVFWDTFSEGSMGAPRITPPPPSFGLPRGSSSSFSLEDVNMDSPSNSSNGAGSNPFAMPHPNTTRSSSGNETPQQTVMPSQEVGSGGSGGAAAGGIPPNPGPPSAAEITRRINGKRRRDDDFDPASFKRRAVSPGMSVHNSPIMQSPLQRDTAPWGSGSRPGSVGGDTSVRPGPGSGAPSENGSVGTPNTGGGGGGGGGSAGRISSTKGRVGFQGMVDTNDGITKLSIE